jgi:hypothetical protein
MTVTHQFVEEPDAGKFACPVLETIAGGDSEDEFNHFGVCQESPNERIGR